MRAVRMRVTELGSVFFFSSRRRHTRLQGDWSSDVCSSDLSPRNLLFVSGEDFNGRVDCGTQGVPDSVSKDRLRGIRIFDISDIAHPKPVANVQTCRGSHTHTLVTDPKDTANVYLYGSGPAPVRSPTD